MPGFVAVPPRSKVFLASSTVLVALMARACASLSFEAASVYVFAASIGILWLATVPLTNGLVAQIFGVQFVSMLSGFVFFSHQIGSFLGVWLGGALFDRTGSYDIVWIIAIALGIVAALVNLPIDEKPVVRAVPAPAV